MLACDRSEPTSALVEAVEFPHFIDPLAAGQVMKEALPPWPHLGLLPRSTIISASLKEAAMPSHTVVPATSKIDLHGRQRLATDHDAADPDQNK